MWQHKGWIVEAGFMTCPGDSMLQITVREGGRTVWLGFRNFRSWPLRITIANGDDILVDRTLPTGTTAIELPAAQANGTLRLTGEIWVPDLEQGNGDDRRFSYHLTDVTFT